MRYPLIAAFVVLAHAAGIAATLYRPTPVKRAPVVKVPLFDDMAFVPTGDGAGMQRCKRTYHGFGFRFAFTVGGYLVTEVAPGYPADRAGLREGDVLEKVHLEGDSVVYVAHRAGAVLRLPMRRETICQG